MNMKQTSNQINKNKHSFLRSCAGVLLALACLSTRNATATSNFSLGAASVLEGPSGGGNSIVLTAPSAGAVWTTFTADTWLHIAPGGGSGAGSATVIFSSDANNGPTRTGTLSIGGQTLNVTQAGSTFAPVSMGPVVLGSNVFARPTGMAVDAAGNAYFTDYSADTVTKWSPANNSFTTLITSGFIEPDGIAVDAAGNVYIADTDDDAIKEWVAASQTLVTIVGGDAGLYSPLGVALDRSGNVYISDTYNNQIREWIPSSNTLVTLVTNLNMPYGIGVDAAGNVYFADYSGAIKEWTAATGAVTNLVSGLDFAAGVSVDSSGSVYFTDAGNNLVQEWNAASQTVSTLASNLNSPHGVAVDAAGSIYFTDTGSQVIDELPRALVDLAPKMESSATGSDALTTVLPASQNLHSPFAPSTSVAWLGVTNVSGGAVTCSIVTNTGPIRAGFITVLGQVTSVTQMGSSFALGATNSLQGPAAGTNSVVLSGDGNSWTAAANDSWLHVCAGTQSGTGSTNVIYSFDANTNSTRTGTLTIAGLTLTITQAGAGYVQAPSPVAVLASTGLNFPRGVAVDASGNVYIADQNNNNVKKWAPSTGAVTTPIINLASPTTLAMDTQGNLYIADSGDNAIVKWDPSTQISSTVPATGLSDPQGVAVDGAGNVYIADTGNNAIKEWVAASGVTATLVSSGLKMPISVAVDAAGVVYFSDAGNNAVREWVPALNGVVTLATSGLSDPEGVAVDGAGNVFITSAVTSAIMEWTAASGATVTLPATDLDLPEGVAVDAAGNVYIADTYNKMVKELPRAFVDSTPRVEGETSGADSLPVVLPATENLLAPFAPMAIEPWLSITGVTNGIVSFNYAASGANRTGYISVLGQNVAIVQAPVVILGSSSLLLGPSASTNSVVLGISPMNGTWSGFSANASWLHPISANHGVGGTNVFFACDANSGATRAGTLTIGGQTVTVTQAGSTYVPAGVPTALMGNGLSQPWGVAADAAGNVYVTDSTGGTVQKWSLANNTVTTLIPSGLSQPTSIALDGSGNLYIADVGAGAIYKWTAGSQHLIPVLKGLPNVFSVAVDSAGDIYFANFVNNTVNEWLAGSGIINTVVSNGLNGPIGLALDAAGNIYIADSGDNSVKEWVAANNMVVPIVSSGLNLPVGVAVDGQGNVYIADRSDNAIKEWMPASNSVATVAAVNVPAGVAVDAAGNVYLSSAASGPAAYELPRAFVDPSSKTESQPAGQDSLAVVLPSTINLLPPFSPTTDQPWLDINGVNNGIVSFAFGANTNLISRIGHLTVLGQSIPVAQLPLVVAPPTLTGMTMTAGGFQLSFASNDTNNNFIVLATSDLSQPMSQWTVIGAPAYMGSGLWQFTDAEAANTQRFYAIKAQ